MMVVIAIIVVLMASLLPVFAGAIKKAKNVGNTHESERSLLAAARALLWPARP